MCPTLESGLMLTRALLLREHVSHAPPQAVASATIVLSTSRNSSACMPGRNETTPKRKWRRYSGLKQPARHRRFLVPGFTVHFRNVRREQIRRRHDAFDGPGLRFMNQGIPIGMDRVQRFGQSVLDPVLGVEHDQAVRIPVGPPADYHVGPHDPAV